MATGDSPAGSLLKVPSSGKSILKAGADPDDTSEIQTKEVYPTEGYSAPAAVERPENVTADYYRNGTPDPEDPGVVAPARQIFPHGIKNDYDGDGVTASIRIRGRDSKQGNQEVDYIPAFTKFILENVREAYSERVQVVETFGDFYAFLYGQRPSTFSMSGTLINTVNHNWLQDYMFFYDNYLRGTKAVERRARAIITYGGRQVEGLIIATDNNTVAIQEEGVPFSFQILVTQRNYLGFSDDFGIVVGPGQSLISDPTLQAIVEQIAGVEGKGESDPGTGDALSAAKGAMGGAAPATASVPFLAI